MYLPILAMGNPHWRISTTASTADLTSGNEDTPDAVWDKKKKKSGLEMGGNYRIMKPVF